MSLLLVHKIDSSVYRSEPILADIQNADAFISIHYDSIKDPSVRGLSTYFYHPWQKKLAVNIHSAVIDQTNMEDRGARFGDYYVIRENNRNAV